MPPLLLELLALLAAAELLLAALDELLPVVDELLPVVDELLALLLERALSPPAPLDELEPLELPVAPPAPAAPLDVLVDPLELALSPPAPLDELAPPLELVVAAPAPLDVLADPLDVVPVEVPFEDPQLAARKPSETSVSTDEAERRGETMRMGAPGRAPAGRVKGLG